MALLTLEYNEKDFPNFMAIANGLDVVSAQALGYVGTQAKRMLKTSILSGQMLDYRGKWTDKAGRGKASYRITRGAKAVIVSSYPANFFTVANSRQRKRDIWGGLKSLTNSRLESILKEFDMKYLEKQMQRLSASPGSRQRF